MEEQKPQYVEGKIVKKDINQKGGPKSFFYLEGDIKKYTCWSETLTENFDVGDEVKISYLEKDNEYNGKTYKNYNIRSIKFKKEGEFGFTENDKEELEAVGIDTSGLPPPRPLIKSENGKIKLGGLYYQIKDIELELITS